MILALFDRLGVKEAESFDHVHGLIEAAKRALRVRDRAITDPDRLPQPPERFLTNAFLDARGRRHRPPQGRAVFGAARAGRHHLDGRRRRVRPGRLLHPVALLGVRLRRGAAAHRRADAEPRHQLLAQPPRAQRAGARAAAAAHAQSGAGGAARRPGHGLRHHGRRRAAADPGGAVHPPRALPAAARRRRSTGRAGSSGGPGAPLTAA